MMILFYCFGIIVQTRHVILRAGDGPISTGMSRTFIIEQCVTCVRGTRRSSPMNMIYSPCKNFASTSESVTTIQGPWIKADSRAIPNVGSVGLDFTVMMNYMRTAGTNTNGVIFVIDGFTAGNISIMSTTALWNSIFGTITSCV